MTMGNPKNSSFDLLHTFAAALAAVLVVPGRSRSWTFMTHLSLSLLLTSVLAYVSWHAFEKWALLFKPQRKVSA